MKVVITAGGKGERLKPLTNNIPKPMVKINGKPVLLHIIEYFKAQNFSDFILTLCYKFEVVKNYFGDGKKFGVKIDYAVEDENLPLGTAGGLNLVKDRLIDESFIVTCGDTLRKLNIKNVIDYHNRKGGLATLVLHQPKNENITSLVNFTKQGRLKNFIERPTEQQLSAQKSIYMNSSFYIFEPDIFQFIHLGEKTDFGYDVLPKLSSKKVFVFPSRDQVLDIGTLEKLKQAEKFLHG